MVLRALLREVLPTTCAVCGRPGPAPCISCWRDLRPAPPLAPPPGLDRCRSLLLYDGAGRELIARLKYRNARSSINWLASGMAELVRPWAGDAVVTWAPTTPARRRDRGFDQAELLARRMARELGRPCRGLLSRDRGPAQTGRAGHDRRHGVVFRAVEPAPATVIVVDDVITTGATLTAAATALRNASSISVIAATAGRTPLKVTKCSADA